MRITNLFEQFYGKIIIFLLNQTPRFFINATGERKITIGFMNWSEMFIDVFTQFYGQFASIHETKLTKQQYFIAEYIPICRINSYFRF